jgi:hypothetical protein
MFGYTLALAALIVSGEAALTCFPTKGRLEACLHGSDCTSWVMHMPDRVDDVALFDHCITSKRKEDIEKHLYLEELGWVRLDAFSGYTRINACVPNVNQFFTCIDGDVYKRDCSGTAQDLVKDPTLTCSAPRHDVQAASLFWAPMLAILLVSLLVIGMLIYRLRK